MKDFGVTLDQFWGVNLNNWMNINPEDLLTLFEKRFNLSDLEISSRVLKHWKEYGLLPEDMDKEGDSDEEIGSDKATSITVKKRNKFDFVGLIYLYILQDLRDFGVSLPVLMKIKQALLARNDLLKLIMQLEKTDMNELKKRGFNTGVFQKVYDHRDEMKEQEHIFPDELRYAPLLTYFIHAALMSKVDIRLSFDKEGNMTVGIANAIGQVENSSNNMEPLIILPLFRYLSFFLSQEKYRELFLDYQLLDEQELLILDLVKKGKYKEISIRPGKNNSLTMELTEELKVENEARVRDLFVTGGYQDIQVKTANGHIRYSEVKTKIKI